VGRGGCVGQARGRTQRGNRLVRRLHVSMMCLGSSSPHVVLKRRVLRAERAGVTDRSEPRSVTALPALPIRDDRTAG
jgi:hypothetical protein